MSLVAADPFSTVVRSAWHEPYTHAFAITPSDTDELPMITRAIYVGGAGDIAVILADDTPVGSSGSSITLKAVPVGTVLPMRVRQVWSTNTTATLLIGLY
jgi:hypothetical protein